MSSKLKLGYKVIYCGPEKRKSYISPFGVGTVVKILDECGSWNQNYVIEWNGSTFNSYVTEDGKNSKNKKWARPMTKLDKALK